MRKNIIIGIGVILFISLIYFFLSRPEPDPRKQAAKEAARHLEKRLEIIRQINDYKEQIEILKKQHDEILKLENDAKRRSIETESGYNYLESAFRLGKVYADYISDYDDQILMDKICEYGTIHGRISPLCNNWELYKQLEDISNTVGVDFGLMIGITYAESHIGANFAPSRDCGLANNRAGIKNDYNRNRNYRQGCWLHQFDSIQHFRADFAKILKRRYIDKGCSTPECISRRRVRGDGKLEGKESWISRVSLFL